MLSRLLVVGLLLALLGAACAVEDDDEDATGGTSGGSSESSGAEEPTTRTTRGVTDDAVKVGGIIAAANFTGAEVGAQARFDRANAEGGVNGRTIEFVGVEDDGNDAAADLAAMERLVQQEEVFALVPNVTSGTNADFPQEANVPLFGWGINPAFCGNPVAFGITGCVTDPNSTRGSNASGKVLAAHFDGNTDQTVAIITDDNDSGRGGVRLIQGSMEDAGFDVVYAEAAIPPPPTTVGDYTPFVNDLLTSDAGGPPDIIILQVSVGAVVGLSNALQPVFDGFVMGPFYDPRLVANPAFEGQGVYTQFLPYEYADENEHVARMIADIEAYDAANGTDTVLSLATAAGYWSADMFLALLEETGEDLTVERLLAASDGWSWEVPGVIGTSTWPANHDEVVPCAALVLVEDGAYVKDQPLTCGEVITLE
jgi:ABC-type branched-subunit amino acid transport system substrate-binding protein